MKKPLVASYGIGQDSTAMMFEFLRRGIRPDKIQSADTGIRDAEKPETYEHADRMDALFRKWWGIGIDWCRTAGMYKGLEDNCLQKAMLPSKAYGRSSCSDKYKHQPMMMDLKRSPLTIPGVKWTRAIGYNASESHRVKYYDHKDFDEWYPLVEWQITRAEVRRICLDNLGYIPIKSACFFCPSSKAWEVRWLGKHHPELAARAVAMERAAMPNLINIKGLGRHWSWESVLAADENQIDMYNDPDPLPCMCFDGDDGEDEE